MSVTVFEGFITRISDRNTIIFMESDELERLLETLANFKQNIIVIKDSKQSAWYISALRVVIYENVNNAKRAFLANALKVKRATVVQ